MIVRYLWNVLISLDQFANTLIGGDPDETISSRAGKKAPHSKGWFYMCRLLHLVDKNHCAKSIEPDEGSKAVIK